MKTRFSSLGIFAAVFAVGFGCRLAAATTTSPDNPIYIVVQAQDPVAFDRMRNSAVNGDELVVATLKAKASDEARFANLDRPVVVLGEDNPPPANAAVLRLTFLSGSVTADFTPGNGARPRYLGVVSNNTSLAFHPDHEAMINELRRAQLAPARRDAQRRVDIEMELYVAFTRVAKEIGS